MRVTLTLEEVDALIGMVHEGVSLYEETVSGKTPTLFSESEAYQTKVKEQFGTALEIARKLNSSKAVHNERARKTGKGWSA